MSNAGTGLEQELQAAELELRYAHGVRTKTGRMADRRTIRLRRHDLVPARQNRSQRAFAHCEAPMRAAEAAYRPVREEVDRHTR